MKIWLLLLILWLHPSAQFFADYCAQNKIENCYLWLDGDAAEKIYQEAGVQTVAVKKAGHMEMAKRNLSELGQEIKLRQCDFRYLENAFEEKFDAILCLTTSLPHLHEDEDLITALKSMKNRLNEGGILILTQGATPATLQLPPIEVVVERKDFTRVYVKEHDDRFQTIHILDLYHSESRLENRQYDVTYRLLFDKEYRELLTKAGFEYIRFYGDYHRNPYTGSSRRLIVVAK